jgi:hypothetical protein
MMHYLQEIRKMVRLKKSQKKNFGKRLCQSTGQVKILEGNYPKIYRCKSQWEVIKKTIELW